MRSLSAVLALPASLVLFISQAAADPQPTAVKKLSFDSSEKLLAQHLAFAPLLAPFDATFDERDNGFPHSDLAARFHPAFARHYDDSEENMLRRAAEALALLEKRSACPSGMNSCDYQGSPNKCCQDGTYCTDVPDTTVGHVACCPDGGTCGGAVAACPGDAVTCPADLGGGCCIAGYICQGVGCVPSASATPSPTTTTTTKKTSTSKTSTEKKTTETTTTSTKTTKTTSTDRSTKTSTDVTGTKSATGGAPYRPTITTEATTTTASDTQTGCPNGFYGCLATHGGGCCRTDRDCQTHSCPPPASTTLVSDGATIVVPATDVPKTSATSTCAGGWFLCGKDAGPVAGCCPSGYDCGTASCFSAKASQTGEVQKEFPKKASGTGMRVQGLMFGGVVMASLFVTLM